MSGSKIVGGSPDPFCPTCGDQAVLSEEKDGKTEHRCANGHEWTVATDGGVPSCEFAPRLKGSNPSETDAIAFGSVGATGTAPRDEQQEGADGA